MTSSLTHSGRKITLGQIVGDLSHRMMNFFLRDSNGCRAVFGDNGAGIGASHQTGWTGLVAKLIQQQEEHHAE